MNEDFSKIIILGDIVPTKSNEKYFMTGDVESLVGADLLKVLKSSNFTIANIETPLTNVVNNPIEKCGPNLSAKMECINGIKALGIDLATLANNHILDYGENGVNDTIRILQENQIDVVGAGKNIDAAAKVYYVRIKKLKVGVYSCAEHEFSGATSTTAGANLFNYFQTYLDIKNAKNNCDYLIVLYHGGKEFYRYPSPELRKNCRIFVDQGADIVVCQHSHCIGSYELYQDSTIIYGQGNFIFDRKDDEFWSSGLVIAINENLNIEYIPVVKKKCCIMLADGETKDSILQKFRLRSNEIKNDKVVYDKYSEFAMDKYVYYLSSFHGREGIFFRILNKLFRGYLREKKVRHSYRKKELLAIKNYIECESHRELLLEAINKKINEIE